MLENSYCIAEQQMLSRACASEQTRNKCDPEGGQGVQIPPGRSQVIWVSIEISIWTPLENVGPPLDPSKVSLLCYKTIGRPL